MKVLKRLRLINWHYFSNTTTDLKQITLLTGPNGTGKSTIIDALQIVLIGSTRAEYFNKAANETKGRGRTLLSYLRGQTGISDDGKVINLRKGNFTSYIAIEIYDDVENKTFSLGAVFDVDSADNISKHYFYIASPFLKNNFSNSETESDLKKVRPMMYKELSSYVRKNYSSGEYHFFDTDIDYQNFIKIAFGNLPDKYFSLLRKAISFAPINNISQFITDYICDADKTIDIKPMQKNIEQYKLLENEAKKLRVKQEALLKIKESYTNYSSYAEKMNLLTYVNARVQYEEAKKKLDSLKEKLEKDNNRLSEISSNLNLFDKQIEDLRSDLSSYQAKKLQSKNYSLTEKLSMKKDNITKQIASIQMAVSTSISKINNYVHDYMDACRNFASFYTQFDSNRFGDKIKENFDQLIELCKDLTIQSKALMDNIDNDKIDFNDLKAFRNDMEALRNQAIAMKQSLRRELYDTSADLQALQKDLTNVNSGKKPFDQIGPSYMAIKNSLESALKMRHTDAYVHIYCDLVDVDDPEWTMALEAALYNQKFNFFVNPEYYQEANRLLKELTETYRYYRVSLVDSDRLLSSDIYADDDSIANLISTNDEGARAYTDYLLGRIKKCETFEEARNSGSGLLKDCTGYRAYGTWYLNKAHARIPFLGTKVSSDTKAISAKDYQDMNRRYNLYTEALNKLDTLLSLPLMSQAECDTYQSDIERMKDISGLQESIKDIDTQMHDVSMGDMVEVENKIQAIEEDIKTINDEREEILTERGSLINETRHLNGEEIPVADRNYQSTLAELKSFDEHIVNEQYAPFYEKLIEQEGMTLSMISKEAMKEYIQAQNKQNSDRTLLLRLRSDYCSTYHLNYDYTNMATNEEFDKELESISKVMLPDYEEKIKQAHDSSVKEFKDDFVYKLRTAIETVNTQIVELNQALEDCHFGVDTYQFKVTPSKDYLEYYNMIMDPLLLKAGDAENLFMEKYKETMDSLFNLISSSTSATGDEKNQILDNIKIFTTYTTYMNFDLLVYRGGIENKQVISLGRSFTSQSGGETQTPFYISILASFASLCRVNNVKDNNTLRLVVFDEAFSKMDSSRIMQSTDLFRQFGLQAILSTPAEKLRDLVSYLDLILVAIHDDKHKRSGLDIYEEKKDKNS